MLSRVRSFADNSKILEGTQPPAAFNLDEDQTNVLASHAKRYYWNFLWLASLIRSVLFAAFLVYDFVHRFDDSYWASPFPVIWTVVLATWAYISSGAIYMSLGVFDLVSHYFRVRFERVNDAIESIHERPEMEHPKREKLMDWILNEHNELCAKLKDYNRFWSKYILYSYFMFTIVAAFTLFQTLFGTVNGYTKTVMTLISAEATFFVVKVALSGSKLTDEVKHS